ncbi:hypothetical protein ACRWOO_29825 [Streptomyces sp. NEAU-PBA10]|uniref:Uncharacterized protein n=1 Tax=Streptomyces tremellae TaxID=1124239 RepID=A0ABP7DTW3_9ACTN
MRSTEAKDLYAGAVVLTGTHLETVASLRRHGSSVIALFEPAAAHRPGRRAVVEPDHDFVLAQLHSVAWVIHSRHRSARSTQDRARVSVPYAVRRHWAFDQEWSVVDRLVEEHTVTSFRPIGLDELPGRGDPTPPPPNPDSSRFYRLRRQGPTVLPTGDAVRAELARLTELHRREHGRTDWEVGQRLPAEGDIYDCRRCTRSPHDLMPMEVVVERTYQDVSLDDLPSDWEYELCPAGAYERHLQMGTVTAGRPPRASVGAGAIVGFATSGSHTTARAIRMDAPAKVR